MNSAGDRRVVATRALLQRGLSQQREGRFVEAELTYEAVLRGYPNHFDALHMLGVLALQTQRPQRAVELITRALAQKSNIAAAHSNFAEALVALRRFEEAERSFGIASALRPGHAETYLGRANALRELGRLEEALASCDQAITLRPDIARAHIGRAFILRAMERPDEMLASCDTALLTQPDAPDAWDKLGAALREINRFDEALAVLETAISEWPDSASSHMNAGVINLQLGRTDPGWRLYDWRNKVGGPVPGLTWPQPRWYGEESLAGKTILIWAEQGLGDTIQFCRYARLLETHDAKVVLSVQARLCALMKTLSPTIEVIAESDPPPKFDLHSPLMSLPLAFNTTPATTPAAIPYLSADPLRLKHWRERLVSHGFKIGICWQGSKLPIDVGRSYSLQLLQRISQIAGVRLVSLQKGPGSEQLLTLPIGMPVETLGPDFDEGPNAFIDTAAAMNNLDLVITSDTSIAHLAGALGRPTWVALKDVPEWRWLLEREDSPWYPQHRLFRQTRRGDWESVIDRMHAELQIVLANLAW
jgi:tetratricopeptide (TPR) repeat protein